MLYFVRTYHGINSPITDDSKRRGAFVMSLKLSDNTFYCLILWSHDAAMLFVKW